MKLVRSRTALRRQASEPTLKSVKCINPDLVLTFHRRKEIVLSKFPTVGATILEKSKAQMASFHGKMQKAWKDEEFEITSGDTVRLFKSLHY